jgi:hypothetical protein
MYPCGAVVEAEELRSSLEALIGRIDPGDMLASDAARLIEELAGIGRLADAGVTLLADVVARAGTWDRRRHSSMAEWLAALAGSSKSEAVERVKTSERVKQLPGTQRRLRQGRLSTRQAREVADGASANPAAEQGLLDTAEQASLGELRQQSQRAKAAADPDPDATRRRIHRERRLREHRDAEGGWCLFGRGTPDAGAAVMAKLRAEQDHVFRAARAAGRRDSDEAYLFDAFVNVVTGVTAARDFPTTDVDAPAADGSEAAVVPPADRTDTAREPDVGAPTLFGESTEDQPDPDAPVPAVVPRPDGRTSGSDAKVIVRVDLPALLRNRVQAGEVCEIAGQGPVAPSVVRTWLDEGAFLAAVVTNGVDVATVAHLGRKFTATQRTALQWIAPTCSRIGCNRSIHLEYDHRTDWADTLRSLASDADRLCRRDHDLKTHHRWALVPGTGKRAFVPPDDPRHPDNQPTRPSPDDPGHTVVCPTRHRPPRPTRHRSTALDSLRQRLAGQLRAERERAP